MSNWNIQGFALIYEQSCLNQVSLSNWVSTEYLFKLMKTIKSMKINQLALEQIWIFSHDFSGIFDCVKPFDML